MTFGDESEKFLMFPGLSKFICKNFNCTKNFEILQIESAD